MAVLDSKYEILSQHTLSEGETVFDAVAPDGTALRIVWFELSSPQEEMQFETYRQLLRKLERKGLAAIHDIVSRPGTHYVAWYIPSTGWGKASEELERLLKDYNYTPNHADIRSEQDKGVVYNLGFNSAVSVPALPVIQEPESTKPAFIFPQWAYQWLIGLGLMAIGFGLGMLGFKLRSNDTLVTIPNLIGQDVNTASERLHGLRLQVETQAVASDETLGTVVATDPIASSDLRPGRKVVLTYAVSPGQVSQVKVPQLAGEMFSSSIQSLLEKADLRLGQVVYIHAKVPDGIILSQTPEASTQANAGDMVNILVSLGPVKEKVFVPNLIGLSSSEALNLISLAGLPAPKLKRVFTSRYLPDVVIEQSIPPNTLMTESNRVLELSLSAQEDLPALGIPSLVGLTLDQARQLAPGFTIYTQEISTPNLPQGVIDQVPPPGSELTSSITLVVNVAPVPIPVPNPYVVIKEPEPRLIRYQFYIEAGISKNSFARLIAENAQGKSDIILSRYVSEGELIEDTWQTTYVGPITFTLYLNNTVYQQQTVNP